MAVRATVMLALVAPVLTRVVRGNRFCGGPSHHALHLFLQHATAQPKAARVQLSARASASSPLRRHSHGCCAPQLGLAPAVQGS